MEGWLVAAAAWYGPATVILLLALAGAESACGRDSSTLRLVSNLACWILGGWAASWLPVSWPGAPVARPFAWVQNVAGPAGVMVAGIVALDLFSYAMHRLEHRINVLWRFHAVHHSDVIVDASTAVRHHPVEVGLTALTGGALFGLLGLPAWAMAATATLMLGWAMVQHADLPWPAVLQRLAAPIFVTPGLHRIHHSDLAQHHGANFGTMFSVWDRIFGTFLPPAGSQLRYGIGPAGEGSTRLDGALLLPLRLGRDRRVRPLVH